MRSSASRKGATHCIDVTTANSVTQLPVQLKLRPSGNFVLETKRLKPCQNPFHSKLPKKDLLANVKTKADSPRKTGFRSNVANLVSARNLWISVRSKIHAMIRVETVDQHRFNCIYLGN